MFMRYDDDDDDDGDDDDDDDNDENVHYHRNSCSNTTVVRQLLNYERRASAFELRILCFPYGRKRRRSSGTPCYRAGN